MNLIDTHCHLYSSEFLDDLPEVIKRANLAGVSRFFMPAIDSSSHESMFSIENNHPEICKSMMGLHPCYVNDNYLEELDKVSNWLVKRPFAAIGEIGLDFYRDKTYAKEQLISFNFQMDLALNYDLPIVIHSRNAMNETIEAIKPYVKKGLKGIFHCFGGSFEEGMKIVDLGFSLGIGGILTYKSSSLAKIVKQLPLDSLVLETDCPFLPPVPYRGQRNESSYIIEVAKLLSELLGINLEELSASTSNNANNIFRSYTI